MEPAILAAIITGAVSLAAAISAALIGRAKKHPKPEIDMSEIEGRAVLDALEECGQEDQIVVLWGTFLSADTDDKVQSCFYKVEEFLVKHPSHPDGLSLRDKIVRAREVMSQKKLERLFRWIFIQIRFWRSVARFLKLIPRLALQYLYPSFEAGHNSVD